MSKSKKKSVLGVAFCAMLFALCSSAEAQQVKKVPRIGYVTGSGDANNPGRSVEAFRQGMRELGYIEGKNILVEYRYAEGKQDRIPGLVAELVQLRVDVVVSGSLTAIQSAKQATKTIPVVMVTTADPVAAGLVDSLARPGGNITGLTRLTRDLGGKRLQLLKEALPKMTRVGILWDADDLAPAIGFKEYEAAGRALDVQVQSLEVRGPNPDFEGAFQAFSKGRASALITTRNSLLNRYAKRIADLAIRKKMPSMCESGDYVVAGGLMAYSANDDENYRRAATYVDKILKGAKPADLPIEQPMKFEFVMNLKTAKQIGLTIPPDLLARATKIIR